MGGPLGSPHTDHTDIALAFNGVTIFENLDTSLVKVRYNISMKARTLV